MHRVTYPTVAEVRTYEPTVADVVKFPDPFLALHLAAAVARVEKIAGRRFMPTRVTEGVTALFGEVRPNESSIRHRVGALGGVLSCTVYPEGGVPVIVAPASLTFDGLGRLRGYAWPEGAPVVVEYWTGLDACPEPMRGLIARVAALYAARARSGAEARSERFEVDADGTRRFFSQPSKLALGMPEIDAIIQAGSLNYGIG
jgi:hypothetical protein